MESILEVWSLFVLLAASFVIGWAAETAQTFIPRALALSLLAWLQTLPEFAVEASIAWHQQRDLMIANLTGSLRLIVGLGLPMIYAVHFFFQGIRRGRFIKEIKLPREDALSILTLFMALLYFFFIWAKGSLHCGDGAVLILIYLGYLALSLRFPAEATEEEEDLPWIGKKIVRLSKGPKVAAVLGLFFLGGVALQLSVDPFLHTLERWSVSLGISTFVFIQWVAPFLSEFPEKVSAFNWARQANKAPMAVLNMVSSNINQWTMLAAMIPIVFSLSLGHFEPVVLDPLHKKELLLTLCQSALAGLLLLDLRLALFESIAIFCLWFIQFLVSSLREPITAIYLVWCGFECFRIVFRYATLRRLPEAIDVARSWTKSGAKKARQRRRKL